MGARYIPCMSKKAVKFDCLYGIKGSKLPMNVPVDKTENKVSFFKSP